MPDDSAPNRNDQFSKLVSRFAFASVESCSAPRVAGPSVTLKRRREETGEEESKERSVQKSSKARRIIDISHLPPLEDRLVKYLDVVFCGCNPGYTSAQIGYHYGNTQNAFWRCLNQSGFTEALLSPHQGSTLPAQYSIGLTDLVSTPSHAFSDISLQERKQSVLLLLQKIAFYKPRVFALNSFTIWSDIAGSLGKPNVLPGVRLKPPSGQPHPALKLPQCGTNRKPEVLPWKIVYPSCDKASEPGVKETLIIPLPATSGANARYSFAEKVAFFRLVHDTLSTIKAGTFNTSHMGEISVDLTDFKL